MKYLSVAIISVFTYPLDFVYVVVVVGGGGGGFFYVCVWGGGRGRGGEHVSQRVLIV